MQTGQTLVLGSAPNSLAQEQNILLAERTWVCTSKPITASYFITIYPFVYLNKYFNSFLGNTNTFFDIVQIILLFYIYYTIFKPVCQ